MTENIINRIYDRIVALFMPTIVGSMYLENQRISI